MIQISWREKKVLSQDDGQKEKSEDEFDYSRQSGLERNPSHLTFFSGGRSDLFLPHESRIRREKKLSLRMHGNVYMTEK